MKKILISLIVWKVIFVNFSYAQTYPSTPVDLNITNERLSAFEAAEKIKWEIAAVAGTAVFLGLKNWNWGSSNTFKFHDEGWFGTNTGSAGADKLGHMYSSYLINEFFTKSLIKKCNNIDEAAKWSAVYSSSIMLLVEVFDGYSVDHGFSYEDVIFNSLGIGISYLKNTVPGLDEKLDLRVEYIPTHAPHDHHPVTDYSGYKYIAALRLSGFEDLKDSPLKYVELHLGYHSEGFLKGEDKFYSHKSTELYFAVSFNLSELLFKPARKYTDSPIIDYADTITRYYQIPKTYIPITIDERTVSY